MEMREEWRSDQGIVFLACHVSSTQFFFSFTGLVSLFKTVVIYHVLSIQGFFFFFIHFHFAWSRIKCKSEFRHGLHTQGCGGTSKMYLNIHIAVVSLKQVCIIHT